MVSAVCVSGAAQRRQENAMKSINSLLNILIQHPQIHYIRSRLFCTYQLVSVQIDGCVFCLRITRSLFLHQGFNPVVDSLEKLFEQGQISCTAWNPHTSRDRSSNTCATMEYCNYIVIMKAIELDVYLVLQLRNRTKTIDVELLSSHTNIPPYSISYNNEHNR